MKKIILLFSFLAVALLACQSNTKAPSQDNTADSAAPVSDQTASYTDLSVAEFKAKMTDPGIVVLDVRTPEETAAGKIDGAEELDFKSEGFSEKLDGLDKSKTYLVYCRSGHRSSNACKMMAEKGFENIYNLVGGYLAWSEEK